MAKRKKERIRVFEKRESLVETAKRHDREEWEAASVAKQKKMEAAAVADVPAVMLDRFPPAEHLIRYPELWKQPIQLVFEGLLDRGHNRIAASRAVGNLLYPPDGSAWVLISKVGWRDHFRSEKRCKTFLAKHSAEIRTRKPSRQRFQVHAGDWLAYWHLKDQPATSDEPSPEERRAIEKRMAEARRKKRRKQGPQ